LSIAIERLLLNVNSRTLEPLPVTERRFPPPWSVEELDACFVVRDHNGQALAYVYFEDEPGRRSAAKLIGAGRGERRIAVNNRKGKAMRSVF
jgi:hypothetical protein